MDKTSTVEIPAGEFTFKNVLTIGEETQIAVQRATRSNGMYGQMMESPNLSEMRSAWNLFRICELDGRIEKAPEGWLGAATLSSGELDQLWKVWTEKSGLFPIGKPDSTPPADTGEGEG